MQKYCLDKSIKAEIEWVPEMEGREDEYRRVVSRENIRREILSTSFTHWLSWECDILVEPTALKKMVPFIEWFDIVSSSYPNRDNAKELAGGIGFSLFRREILESQKWTDGGGYKECDPDRPNCYYSGDSWWMQRAIWKGYKHMEFTNFIRIEHIGI
jgi:hypothetical protein